MNLTELKKAAEEATEIEALDVNEDLSIFGSTSWSRTQRHCWTARCIGRWIT